MPLFDAHSPDGTLIAAALAGEHDAFAQLVRRYERALLLAAISRLGRRELAEEAVQEAFLGAHRWLATYDSRYSFRTWLWTILLNQCSRQARREARAAPAGNGATQRRCSDDEVFTQRNASPAGSPLQQLLARESSDRIHQLLGRLPAAQADALRLRFFGELTFPEIATALRCSEAGAKHRVKTALLKLSRWLLDGASAAGDRRRDHRGDLP